MKDKNVYIKNIVKATFTIILLICFMIKQQTFILALLNKNKGGTI